MIRWITDKVGTAAWDNAREQPDCALLDVRDLVDKSGNFPEGIRRKVEEGVALLQQGGRLIVCCDYGMSRSNAIAAGILSIVQRMTFADAIRLVLRATGEKSIQIDVLAAVRTSVEQVIPISNAANQSRSILVTGGSGFVGSALLRQVPAGWRILAPSRQELDLLGGTVELDLFVREHQIDTLVHLAHPRVLTTNQAMGESLVQLKNVLDVCCANQTRLVYLSSWEVFSGYRSSGLLADEGTPTNPKGTYGQSKCLAETLIAESARHFGLQYLLLRVSPVYGASGDRPKFIANFLNKALAGQPIVAHRYANGFPALDLLYLDDLIAALIAVLSSNATGVFHVGTSTLTSTTDVARAIIELTGSTSTIEHREITGHAPNVMLDSTRLRDRFGWAPKVDVRDGLLRILENLKTTSVTARRGAA
jgi:nucleoside-diphosphate-sugar epimerase